MAAVEGPPARVRVVLGEVARAARPPVEEQADQRQLREALVRGLMRTQLAIALPLAALVVFGLGSLPLLFSLAPHVAATRPYGVALPWLLLGAAAYPFLFLIGAAYVFLAERTEQDFAELVERRER